LGGHIFDQVYSLSLHFFFFIHFSHLDHSFLISSSCLSLFLVEPPQSTQR
jgi:hypothetical protein